MHVRSVKIINNQRAGLVDNPALFLYNNVNNILRGEGLNEIIFLLFTTIITEVVF